MKWIVIPVRGGWIICEPVNIQCIDERGKFFQTIPFLNGTTIGIVDEGIRIKSILRLFRS